MTASAIVQPPGHTVVIEHESIQSLVLFGDLTTTVVEVPGPQGPPGVPGSGSAEPDIPNLTLLFENQLV
jgi:hypothetical protein